MSDTTGAGAGAGSEFEARTPWPAWAAILATTLIVLAALVVTAGIGLAWLALVHPDGVKAGISSLTQIHSMLGMVVIQAAMIGLTYWCAGWFGGVRAHVLSLIRPVTMATFLIGLAGMALILAPYNLVIYSLWPNDFTTDLRPFADLAKSDAALVAAIVVAVGAPLSEELLFRGFLLPALAKSQMGFAGAALLSTLAWTGMHWGYSAIGLIEVFVIGIYFSWLLWRFGSLWLTMALHAFYNAAQFVILTQVSLPPVPA